MLLLFLDLYKDNNSNAVTIFTGVIILMLLLFLDVYRDNNSNAVTIFRFIPR